METSDSLETNPDELQLNHKPRFGRKLAAAALLGSLMFAACGSDTDTTTADTDEGATEEVVEEEAMDEEAMEDEAMEEEVDFLGAFGPACAAVPTEGEGSFAGMADDTAATAASNNPLLTTLVTAVVEADLVDTLNSDGPFTIFAPTNDAFAAIPEDILAAVLADQDLLTSVLTYHVLPGDSLGAEDLSGSTMATVEGGELTFGADGVVVNEANVLCSNIPVANGTVHVIDSVLLPQVALDAIATLTADTTDEAAADEFLGASGPACAAVPADGEGSFAGMADDTAATAASNNPLLSTLVTAVVEAELVDTLNSDGPFTIFAPTNDAFAALDPATLEAVLADKEQLTSILTLHVVPGQFSAQELIDQGSATTVNGADVSFEAAGTEFTVNGAAVLCQNVPTSNATVHIIDTVLLPG